MSDIPESKHPERTKELYEYVDNIPEYPKDSYSGKGVVICGGGPRYFTCAYVNINMLRSTGCLLPIEVWHLGPEEMDDSMRKLLEPLNAVAVDAYEVMKEHPVRRMGGWELNPYSIVHSSFEEVLFLDADNVSLVNPEYLFDCYQYLEKGAIFWPDYRDMEEGREIWGICGVPYRKEPEFESGQIVVDKEKCWKEINTTMFLNEHSDFYYKIIHGDKDTFRMAWHVNRTEFCMPSRRIHRLPATMCQHDLWGNRIFQHRNMDKWKIRGKNQTIKGFLKEDECLQYLQELKGKWNGTVRPDGLIEAAYPISKEKAKRELTDRKMEYIREGHDQRTIQLDITGTFSHGSMSRESNWEIEMDGSVPILNIKGQDGYTTCSLTRREDGTWKGKWLMFEKMPVTLKLLGKNMPQE